MKNLIIALTLLSSISAFAKTSTLGKVAKIVAEYTPLSVKTILSNENLLNRPILNNYVAGGFFGNLNSDIVKEFGECSHGTLWERKKISIIQLSEEIAKQCKL